MAPATACVAPSIIRTPPIPQQLQQRHVQQRQAPVSQQYQGQQRLQPSYVHPQNQQQQNLHQQHHPQQRQTRQQQQQHVQSHLPQQQRHSQPQQHLHVDQHHMVQHLQVQQQSSQDLEDSDVFSRLSLPFPASLPPHPSGSPAAAVSLTHLSHNATWCSGHLNQEGRGCVADSAMVAAMRQQLNSVPSSDRRQIPGGLSALYLSPSGVQLLPAAARSGTPAAVLPARNKSGSSISPSSVCTLASSGSGVSDISTSPDDLIASLSASVVSLDSSHDSTVQFAGQPSAVTSDLANSVSSNKLSRTTISGELSQQPPRSEQQQQQRNQLQQRQLRCQPLLQLSRRHPVASTAQQQQQRLPRQQRDIVSADTDAAVPARQLRYTAGGAPPVPAAARFQHGSRNSSGPQQGSTRTAGNRRQRQQMRHQQDQRTQLERQRQPQLPRQHTHGRCTSGVQRRQQYPESPEACLRTSVSSYPTDHLMATSDASAVAITSATLPRAPCEELPLSVDDWDTSRHTNSDAAVLRHFQGLHMGGGRRSSSPLVSIPGVGCEAFTNAAACSRGLGLPPLPYLCYDLRIGGASVTGCRRAPGDNGNAVLPLSCFTSALSFEDKATRRKDSIPSLADAGSAIYAPPQLYDVAATAAGRGYPSSPKDIAAASNSACLTSKKPIFDRTAAAAAQKAAKSAADAATAAAAVAAATAAAAGVNSRNAVNGMQRRLAQNAALQCDSGEMPQQDLHLRPGAAKLQMVPDPGASVRKSAVSGKPQQPANRPRVTATRSDHWQEQQPTVALPLLCGPALPKPPATHPLHTGDFQIPCSGVVTAARPTLLSEDASLRADTRRLEKTSTATPPCAVGTLKQVTTCKAHAGVVPASGGASSLTAGECPLSIEAASAKGGGAGAKTPLVPVCAPGVEACTCRSSDHIGRGRGPGGPDVVPGSNSPVGASCTAAAAPTNDYSAANAGQRASDLERTWLRLLCESEAVAEGKVRTCRSSAPIPPAVLLRAPEKLEGHVISSSSRDIVRPPFYSFLQEEGVREGGKAVGTDGAAAPGWLENLKSADGSRTDAEQSSTRQRQVSGSSDTTSSTGCPGGGGVATAILETLHLEKLLQSAIYGAVFRANLHTVFRTARASKKPRQGDEDGQDIDSRCSSGVTDSSLHTSDQERKGAHMELLCGGTATAASAAAAERTERGGSSNGIVEGAEESFGRSQDIQPEQMQKGGLAEDNDGENLHGEARGTIELRSQVVAVKVLSLSLQLNASPSLQEDFLSELKFYPYLKGHKNILVPYRIYVDRVQQLLLLVFPFAEFEDLFEVLKKRKKPFAEAEVQWICKQLLQAVLFLHRRGIAMRDLSLENVLMCRCPETGFAVPKLTDPGQAVIVDQEAAAATRAAATVKRYSTVGGNNGCRGQQLKSDRKMDAPRGRQWCDAACHVGAETTTRGVLQERDDYDPPAVLLAPDKIFGKSFRPPEVYQQCSYNPFKVDSFCMGWMTYYLLTKQQLFQRAAPSDDNWRLLSTKNASDLLLLLGRKNGAVLSVEGLDFVVRLLEDDPQRRMTIYQALAHPFIALSKPCPVLADKLFPDDAVAQEQHMAKQRQFHAQLLQQKQSLLQLYNMRWRDRIGLHTTIATKELPQKQESKDQPEHERCLLSDKGPAHCEQMHCEVAVFPVHRRTSPCQTMLHKRSQTHQRQIPHQQQQELRVDLWQNHSWRMPPRPHGGSSAADPDRARKLRQERLGQAVTQQQLPCDYVSDSTAEREPYVAATDDRHAAAYEEIHSERPAPTLLVQHSTLLHGKRPTPSTSYRCWSAGLRPDLQKVHNLSTCEKPDADQAPRAPWEVEICCATQALDGIIQRSEDAPPEGKERELQFAMPKTLQCAAVSSDTAGQQSPDMTGSQSVQQSPRLQPCSEYANEPVCASSPQLSQWGLTTKPPSESRHQINSAKKEVTSEALGQDMDVCRAEAVLLASATVQIPVIPLAGFARAVDGEGIVQLQNKRPILEKKSPTSQSLSIKQSAEMLPYRAFTQKEPDSGPAQARRCSFQEEKERTTARVEGLSAVEMVRAVKTGSRTDTGTVVADAFAAAEPKQSVTEDNLQAFTGTDRTSVTSGLPVETSFLTKDDQEAQTTKLSGSKGERAGCVISSVPPSKCMSTDLKPKALPEDKLGLSSMPMHAATEKGCKTEPGRDVEASGRRKDSGKRQSHGGVSVKTVNSSVGKGRRGPSSSSTETSSTAGENCGGRSDSDYCVGVRINGSASHYSRGSVSCEGLQKCLVRPPVAGSSGTGKMRRNGGVHEKAASAESL